MKNNYLKVDYLCGIERDPRSPSRGELVCPLINLWREPSSAENRSLTGKLKDGSRVYVLEYRRIDGVRWCMIKEARWLFPRKGWVRIQFLLTSGARE